MNIKRLLIILLVVLGLALLPMMVVFAQGVEPPVGPPLATPTPSQAEFIAFVLMITAFFKQQFGVTGKPMLALTFVVALVLWFLPDLEAMLPAAAVWIEKFIELVKLFLASMGAFDLTVNVGAKIATATATKSGKLSTSEVK